MPPPVPHQLSENAVNRLHRELALAVRGEVRFDAGSKAVYSADASNYRQIPIGVVLPHDRDDLLAGLAVCKQNAVPILMRGGGTSQNGQCVNVAVVFDTSKYMNKVVHIDPDERSGLVEPGVVCDTLRDATEKHGLTFAPDPATHSRCTIGGMIGNNSCGAHSVMAGKTVENIEALEIVTYDGARFWVGPTSEAELAGIIAAGGRQGEIYAQLKALRDRYGDLIRARFPQIKRRVSGFNLDQLLPENDFNVARALVGTEGTCALTLQAKVRLVHSPSQRVLLVTGFPDIYTAADAVPDFMLFEPIAIEGLDRAIIRGLQARGLRSEEIALLPDGDAWVVLEFGATTVEQALAMAERAAAHLRNRASGPNASTVIVAEKALQTSIWSIRETGASATALSIDPAIPDPSVGWEDAAVDPLRLGDYLRAFQALVDRYGYQTSLYGHFGDGCVHARITFDLRSAEGVRHWRLFLREAAELVVAYGGSLSGEHGDGQAKAEFLPILYGQELMSALEQFKQIWDPDNKMNPGKVVHAYKVDDNLRMGPTYRPIQLATKLDFRSREGNGFSRAVERCIGMGKCRSLEGGTMCPSYRASREERFSTRGRAHLLFEMLQGDVIRDGWQSKEVKEALDTCLSCKGCRSDCPTHTDMASYKAEFLSHYYENKRRPRQAYFMGMIGIWAPWASRIAPLINAVNRMPLLSGLAKRIAGVAAERRLPRFASKTFRSGFQRRGKPDSKRVLLWVDTFNDHFSPEIAAAAAAVLAHLGYDVVLPQRHLCCGRPLYDFGMLDRAKQHLTQIVETLAQEIADGTPLVGLEPGCLSVFKDELLKQLPDDPRAVKLAAQTTLFADFISADAAGLPQFDADVLVHNHCHQKSLFGTKGEVGILQKMGARYRILDSGCCGMAGSFGFDPEHYAMSQQIGEQVLFPAVRAAAASTYIVTNGFSCREQIAQGTMRQPMHIAELVQLAIKKERMSLNEI